MYEIYIQTEISAAHRLRDHPGPCRNLHGHNWTIEVRAGCERLNDQGMGIDFAVLKDHLAEICARLDHVELNGIPFFSENNPTAENLARYIFVELANRLEGEDAGLISVEVNETPGSGVVYRG